MPPRRTEACARRMRKYRRQSAARCSPAPAAPRARASIEASPRSATCPTERTPRARTRAPTRGRESQVWSYRFSSSCAWISATGHALAERRVLKVDHGEPGGADQHQLLPQARRVDLAVEDIDRRYKTTGIPRGVVNAKLPVRFRRSNEIADGNRLDGRTAGVKTQLRHVQRDPQHLHRQRRHEPSANADDKRHAPDHVFRGSERIAPCPPRPGRARRCS